jgi:hypothetical protein
MDDELLRLECLKRAQDQGLTGDAARSEADHIFNWLKGRTPSLPLEQGSVTIGGGKARVVGRDGDLDSPFKDYVKE